MSNISYKFEWDERLRWAGILSTLFPQSGLLFIHQGRIFRTKTGNLEDIGIAYANLGTSGTGPVLAMVNEPDDSDIFWKILPRFYPENVKETLYMGFTTAKSYTDMLYVAHKVATSFPKNDMIRSLQIDIPVRHIGSVLKVVHETTPLAQAYYSPKTDCFVLRFKNGRTIQGNEGGISNCCHFKFDLNTGLDKESIEKFPEMQEDLERWKNSSGLGLGDLLRLRKPLIKTE